MVNLHKAIDFHRDSHQNLNIFRKVITNFSMLSLGLKRNWKTQTQLEIPGTVYP